MHQLWHKADLSIPLGSLFGDERTLASCKSMSAFGGKADIGWMRRNVCFRPKADINTVGQTVRVSPRAAQPTPVDLESQGWL